MAGGPVVLATAGLALIQHDAAQVLALLMAFTLFERTAADAVEGAAIFDPLESIVIVSGGGFGALCCWFWVLRGFCPCLLRLGSRLRARSRDGLLVGATVSRTLATVPSAILQ